MLLNRGNMLLVCKEKYYKLAYPENESVIYIEGDLQLLNIFLDELYNRLFGATSTAKYLYQFWNSFYQ